MHVLNKVGFLLPELCETSDPGLLFAIISHIFLLSLKYLRGSDGNVK